MHRRSVFGLMALGVAPFVSAQEFPDKPITVVIGFPPGSLLDGIVRLVAAEMQKRTGQPLVIDFKSGAGSTIAARHIVNAKPDGYTLFFNNTMSHHPLLITNGVESAKEMAPVSLFATAPVVVVVNAKVRANTMQELVALSKRERIRYGVTGGTSQLTAVLLKEKGGLVADPIPYRGVAPSATALLTGEIDVTSAGAQTFLPHISSGALRPLLVTSNRRYSVLPNVPTATEAGVPSLAPLLPSYAMWAPPGTPKAILDKLSSEFAIALRAPGIAEQMLKTQGAEAVGSTPEELLRSHLLEVKAWEEAARLANYRPQ